MNQEELLSAAEEAAMEFDELCRHRWDRGAEKYGPGKFLTVDTMNEALYEVADLSNYARMTFIRIRLLQRQLEEMNEQVTSDFTKELQ
jgi:hypothetical protein